MRCHECGFYDDAYSLCRRRPPAIVDDEGDGGWPAVWHDDWCGDFERRQVPLPVTRATETVDFTLARSKLLQQLLKAKGRSLPFDVLYQRAGLSAGPLGALLDKMARRGEIIREPADGSASSDVAYRLNPMLFAHSTASGLVA